MGMSQHQGATWMEWTTVQNAVYILSKNFATVHHTCMLHHVLKVPNALAKCNGTVPPAYHQQYLQLYNSLTRAADDNAVIVSDLQSNAVFTSQSSKKSSCQMTIQTGLQCTSQSDIHHTNNAILEMAIADFFYCKNIPDRVVESTQFKQLLEKAKYVGSDFKIPHRKKLEARESNKFYFLYI